MLRRYLIPTTLIMILSGGAAALAYRETSTIRFSATCVFQAAIYLSRNPPSTPEHQEFIALLAIQQVGSAIASGTYTRAATATGIEPSTLVRNISTHGAPGLGAFVVTARDPARETAKRMANATCEDFVTTIKAQREKEIAAQIEIVEGRIATVQAEIQRLESIPLAQRTRKDTVLIQSQRLALQYNSTVFANIISLPPADIAMLSPAAGANRSRIGSLRNNLIIALVVGLLACFLYILVGEVIVERRRHATPSEPASP